MRGRPQKVDWSLIEPHYRAGIKSVNELAAENGISETAIRKHAQKNNWSRDLLEGVRVRTREMFVEDLAREGRQSLGGSSNSNNSSNPLRADDSVEEIRESSALTQTYVLRDQRKTIGVGQKLTFRLLDELDAATSHVGELEDLINAPDTDPKRRTAMLKAVSLPGRAAVMRDIATATRTWVNLERQAFGIVEEISKPPAAGDMTAEQLRAEIATELVELGLMPAPTDGQGVANKPSNKNGATH